MSEARIELHLLNKAFSPRRVASPGFFLADVEKDAFQHGVSKNAHTVIPSSFVFYPLLIWNVFQLVRDGKIFAAKTLFYIGQNPKDAPVPPVQNTLHLSQEATRQALADQMVRGFSEAVRHLDVSIFGQIIPVCAS
jgi:hypothetical protein